MTDNIWLMLLLQVILIALNAIFACAEIAVISFNENKLEKLEADGNKKAARLHKLTKNPAKFLATIQVAITLSGFLGSAFAAENFSGKIVDWLLSLGMTIDKEILDTISVIFITLILSFFTLVFGELVPKRVAMRKSEKMALGMSSTIYFISKLFAPIVALLTASTNGILRLIRIDPHAEDEEVSEEDIKIMVDAGSKSGSIDNEEKTLIQNIFEFDDLTAGEIATHRTDVIVLWLEDSAEEWDRIIRETGHSVYPICTDSADDVVGILKMKDYLLLTDKSRDNIMSSAVRPAYFVPESVKADVLFRNMKMTKNAFAVVLDEYGGVFGVITMNDLIERLVGDFQTEESDDEEIESPEIEQIGSDEEPEWRIKGATALSDVEKELGITFPETDCDTFGGYIFGILGAIPDDGSRFSLESDGIIISVIEVEDHQIITSTVKLATKEEEETAVASKQRSE